MIMYRRGIIIPRSPLKTICSSCRSPHRTQSKPYNWGRWTLTPSYLHALRSPQSNPFIQRLTSILSKRYFMSQSKPQIQPKSTPQTIELNKKLNSLIKNRDRRAAEQLFERMKTQKLCDEVTFVLMTNFYKSPYTIEQIMDDMKKLGHPITVPIYTTLLTSYAREGNTTSMEKWFEKMQKNNVHPDVTVFTTMINAYGKLGKVKEMSSYIEKMKSAQVKPNLLTYSAIINGYAVVEDMKSAYHWWNEMKTQDEQTLYANIRPSQRARLVGMEWPYGSMINWLGKHGKLEEMWNLFKQMKESGYSPKLEIYTAIMHILSIHNDIDAMRKLLDEMKEVGVTPSTEIINFVIQVLYNSENTKPEDMYSMLQLMDGYGLNPNVHTFTFLLNFFARKEMRSQLALTYKRMNDYQVKPDVVMFNSLINTFGQQGKIDHMSEWLKEMLKHGILPDHMTYSTLIHSFGKEGYIHRVQDVVNEMKSAGMQLELGHYNALISAYGKNGDLKGMLTWFSELQKVGFTPDRYTLGSLLSSFAKASMHDKVELVFKELPQYNVKPTCDTFGGIINAYGGNGDLDNMFKWWERMKQCGVTPTVKLYNSLLHWLAASSTPESLEDMFQQMSRESKPNTHTFTSILSGYEKRGDLEHALSWFERMKSLGVEPCRYHFKILKDLFVKVGEQKHWESFVLSQKDL